MKNYLYYNEDSINSILAQSEKGLLTVNVLEDENSITDSANTSDEERLTGDLSSKLFGMGATITGDKAKIKSESEAVYELIKNVQEKVLHDYAFDKVLDYLSENKLLVTDNYQIGDMLLIKDKLAFFDSEYILSLFSEDGVIKYINDQNNDAAIVSINNSKEQLAKNKALTEKQKTVVKAKIVEEERKIKKQNEINDNQRKDLKKIIKLFQDIVPYERFIMIQNFLIPIDDNCLRDKPKIVAFKYGGELSLLGYITNIIEPSNEQADESDREEESNPFRNIYSSLNQVMLGLFGKNEKVYIVHPIAIYYENDINSNK